MTTKLNKTKNINGYKDEKQPFQPIPVVPLINQIFAIVLFATLLAPLTVTITLSLSLSPVSKEHTGKKNKKIKLPILAQVFCIFEGIAVHMQIFVQFLIVSSVFGFHKGFRNFIIGGLVLMDCVSCLKGCGVVPFVRFKELYRILGLFLLFGLGLKFLFSNHFYYCLLQFLSGKSGKSKMGLCSKNVDDVKFGLMSGKIEMEKIQNLNSGTESDSGSDSDDEFFDAKNNEGDEKEEYKDEDVESDITVLREMLKIERRRVNNVCAELAKERAAAATAAEEAMAMILRLQNEKSLVEMEWTQYRRLAEEKQIHDQHVIRSLQWLVWQHELQTEDRPATPCRRYKLKEDQDSDEPQTCFNGNILDALENVLYSSRDSDCLSPLLV